MKSRTNKLHRSKKLLRFRSIFFSISVNPQYENSIESMQT